MIWDALSSDIRRHEERHAEIARNQARIMERQILALPPQSTCERMQELVTDVSTRGIDEHDRLQARFDRIEAVNFQNREAAQSLVDSVKYPYGVKWLHHPKLPARDPFRIQKAAQMLVSTFGLLGILIGGVLAGGAIFGTTIFLRRRKQMREVFSDAGSMLRLEIDPFESRLLGLPPKQD